MKHFYQIIMALVLCVIGYDVKAQCSCTTTITGTDAANHVIGSGQTLCIASTGTCTGLITVGTGGILCNQGTINSTNLWVAGGTLNNYGTINTDKILVSGQGVFSNRAVVTMDSLLVTNIYSLLTNYNNGSITGLRLGNSDNSSITNNGDITVDYMADSMASFTNNATGSFIVNMDFANAYNSGYWNYGYYKVSRDFYNSTNSIFEMNCMGVIGRDWYNTALVTGPTSGCGGFNISGGSYNTGTIGSASTHLDLCDAGNPTFGIDGPGGTINSTTTYCSCSNSCVALPAGIKEIETSEIVIASLYPNPSVNSVSIKMNIINAQALTIEIFDMMGKKQMFSSVKAFAGENTTSLDVTKLSQGSYILSVTDEHKKQTKKIFNVIK
ncbi:MAG: Secretion system C-terminal sorting domain [Bacteroidota bacterium]|jgi:hypothetical protein|nr:Secretion system C-terminal sorting domain [Bacteroidota bacterium]